MEIGDILNKTTNPVEVVGFFEQGFTFTEPSHVGVDSAGSIWSWTGLLPHTVEPGTNPDSNTNFEFVAIDEFRDDLSVEDSDVVIAGVLARDLVARLGPGGPIGDLEDRLDLVESDLNDLNTNILPGVNADLADNAQKLIELNQDLDYLNDVTLVQVSLDLADNAQKLVELDNDLTFLNNTTLVQVRNELDQLNTDISNITNVTSDLDQELQDLVVSTNTQISNLRDETDTAIQQLSDNTTNSLITVNTSILNLDDKIEQYQSDFTLQIGELDNTLTQRIEETKTELQKVQDSVKVEINKNMLDRKESDKLLFETTALAVQLRQNQFDITNAIFEVDPTTGTIRNLAYAYTDNQFTQAGLLIDGVTAEVQLQAQRVTSAEDRITNAESELLLQAGQINLRATYTEVNQAIAGAIDAILPAYSFGFFNSSEGWTAVNGTLTPATSKINLTWGDIQNTSLSYSADENPLISISIERTGGSGWTGNIIVTFDDNSTQTYTDVIEDIPIGSVFVRNLNLDGESTYTGNVTGIRLVLGASTADTFTVNSITIGKPSAALTELEGITAQINQVGIELNALEASLTNYVTVDQYTTEGVTRSNVETVLNGLDSYAAIQATLQEFDTEDTLTKANYAALWVDAANANIEQTVQSYNAREGGLDDQLETITGDLVVASSLIDAANGRIQEQIVNISGIQSKSKDLEQVALQAEYQLYLSKKNQLEQGVAIALAKNELNTISNEQLALAEEILLLEAKFGTDVGQVNATLFELNQAIADETEARVQAVQTLETDFNQAISASATSILETVSNTEQSLSQQILNLQTEFNDEITTNVNQLLQAISDEESARITQFNQLQTNFGNEIQAARTDLTNLISTETDAIASQITTLETNVQNNYASKTELTNAVTTERDARIESISTLESSFNSTIQATKNELTELVSDESSARATEINTLTTNFQNTYATKTEVTNLVTTETDARIEAIETLATNVEDNYATISEVQQIQNDVNSSKALSQTALVSISGVQKKSDSTALEQIIEGYRLYLAEKNQLELGVSIARAETGLQTETNERLALAQEVTVLEAKLGTAEGTFSAEINRLDRAIVDPDGAVASSILEATTVLEGDTRVPVSTIAIDARSLAEDNQQALATIKTELVGVDGSYNEAALILKTAVDDAGEAVSRAFLGTSVLQPGDDKYTITGLTVDSQSRGIRFQGDLFELVNGVGTRKLYWNNTQNEWQIDGDILLTGSIRGDALVANAITGDKIAANTISADKIVANSIGVNQLAANSVNASKIVAESITGDKIAANSISTDKLVANSVNADKLAANSVNADKIVANTITGDKIAANTISADKLVANTITADQIAANAVTASKIQANAIDGKTITGSLIRTAASGTRVEIGNPTLPIWYGTGTVNTTNGQFYVDNLGNVVARNKFSVNVGGNNLFYYDETTQTLTLNGRLIVGGYTVSSEADIRALDGVNGSNALNLGWATNRLSFWSNAGANWTITTPSDAPTVPTVMQYTNSSGRDIFSERMAVVQGKKYRVSGWFKQTSSNTNYLAVAFQDANGNNIEGGATTGWSAGTYWYHSRVNQPFPTSWTFYSFEFGGDAVAQIPANARTMQIGGLFFYQATVSGTLQINNYRIEEVGEKGAAGVNGSVGAGFYSVNVNTNKPTINNTYLNSLFTPTSVAGRNPVNKDTFFVKWLNAQDAYEFNGTDWIAATLVVNGSIIASGTIAGDRFIAGTEISGPIITGPLIRTAPSGMRTEIQDDGTYMIWVGEGTKTDANGIFWLKKNGTGFIKGEFFQGQIIESKLGTSSGTQPPRTATVTHSSAGKPVKVSAYGRYRLVIQGDTSGTLLRPRLTLTRNGTTLTTVDSASQGIYDTELNRTEYLFATINEVFIDTLNTAGSRNYAATFTTTSGPTGTVVSSNATVSIETYENKLES